MACIAVNAGSFASSSYSLHTLGLQLPWHCTIATSCARIDVDKRGNLYHLRMAPSHALPTKRHEIAASAGSMGTLLQHASTTGTLPLTQRGCLGLLTILVLRAGPISSAKLRNRHECRLSHEVPRSRMTHTILVRK